MHETSILNDTLFWYAVAVVLFLILAFTKIRGPILGWLDSEIAKIRNELLEAKKLHAEAEATLAEYRARQQDAEKEAQEIIAKAKKDAERLRAEAIADMKALLERQEQLFIDRVRLAHEDAVEEVRAFVIDEMLVEARGKLNKMADGSETSDMLNRIIEDLPKLHQRKA